jgi:hypothetical protein
MGKTWTNRGESVVVCGSFVVVFRSSFGIASRLPARRQIWTSTALRQTHPQRINGFGEEEFQPWLQGATL